MISGQQVFFFSSNLLGRIFFSLLNALQDFFFLSSFLCRIFFPQKSVVFTFTECIYIYIVVIAVIGLIWSCKALNVVSYTKSFLYSYMFSECHSLESFNI